MALYDVSDWLKSDRVLCGSEYSHRNLIQVLCGSEFSHRKLIQVLCGSEYSHRNLIQVLCGSEFSHRKLIQVLCGSELATENWSKFCVALYKVSDWLESVQLLCGSVYRVT